MVLYHIWEVIILILTMSKKQQLEDAFAVIVDGKCEARYLDMLKQNEPSVRIIIDPEIPQDKVLADLFEIVKEKAKVYTKVFWIVDLDVIIRETDQARPDKKTLMSWFLEYQMALKDIKNVVIIVNNLCFEFWILQHFEPNNSIFPNYESLEKELKKYLYDYEKSKKYYVKSKFDIWQRLKPDFQTACKNAKKLGIFDANNPEKALAEMFLFFEEKAFKSILTIQ